jgi:3'-phosphoadenosine 5'-phosphosulfate sulfotransferase (PAPS reductase)/FAD synthetase
MLHTYETRAQLAKRYSVSVSTVDNRQRQIKQLIGKRYPPESLLDNGGNSSH